MKTAIIFTTIGLGGLSLSLFGWLYVDVLWPLWLLALYASVSVLLVATLYWLPQRFNGAQYLFKNTRTGRLSALSYILFAPYLLAALVFWSVRHTHAVKLAVGSLKQCMSRRNDGVALRLENTYDEIAPGVYLGRRLCSRGELPPGVGAVVDLTAEFVEPRDVVSAVSLYLCLPVLDTSMPPLDDFVWLVDQLSHYYESRTASPVDESEPTAASESSASSADRLTEQAIYVHCANGHGRSASVVAALLLRQGTVASIEAAEQYMRRHRPTVALHRPQRVLLQQYQEQLINR
jgi:hypothetical protein